MSESQIDMHWWIIIEEFGPVSLWTEEHINIIITSTQEGDNVILNQVWTDLWARPSGVRVIKTTGNTGIYRPSIFIVRSGPNQYQ